jgi:hypothetical protein
MFGVGALGYVARAIRNYFVGSSLDLRFTGADQTLDPRVTFTRTSNATVTDSTGTLVYAPHNLLTFSESFDNAGWVKTDSTVSANTTQAPNITSTGDKFVEGTLSVAKRIQQNATILGGSTVTFSCNVKAAERNIAFIGLDTVANSGFGVAIDMTTGTAPAGGFAFNGGTFVGFSITPLDGGWLRVSVTGVASASGTSFGCRLELRNGTTTNYTGDGTSGVFLWGAQLNVGSLQPYYPTTRKNLLGFTQEFDNAAWTKIRSSATANTTVAPDGSTTADSLIEDTTASNTHYVRTPNYTTIIGSSLTFSVYLKGNTRTKARVALQMFFTGSAYPTTNPRVDVDLATGVLSGAAGATATSIVDAGNGWYRISVSAVANAAASDQIAGVFLLDNSGNQSYTGDGTSGIFIWGAQLSDSASLDPYVYNPGAAPAAAAYFGPRFDYDPVTLAPKGLLIEEQRTNSIRNNTGVGAVAGTPGTLPTNWSVPVASDLTTNVIGTGISAGVSYIDLQIVGTSNSTSYILAFESNSQIAALQNQNWSESLWISHVAGSFANISATSLNIRQSNILGSQVAATVVTFSQPTSTLARVSGTATLSEVTTAFVTPGFRLTIANGAAIDITLRIGLPQLEQGAFATSPILTTTAAATRAADVAVMTGANFSNWYNAANGTLFAEASSAPGGGSAVRRAFVVDDGSTANRMTFAFAAAMTGANFTSTVASTLVSNIFTTGALTPGLNYKFAGAYATDDYSFALSGAAIGTDTSGAVPTVNAARIGQGSGGEHLNGHVSRIAFFPRKLSSSELQGITS